MIQDEFNELPAELREQHRARLQSEMVRRRADDNFTALRDARKKVAEIAAHARDDVFDDWVRRGTTPARTPDEWTPARELYASYVAYAQRFGSNRRQRAQSTQVMATQTAWGRMMGTLTGVGKTRRTSGMYYSLRCKRA